MFSLLHGLDLSSSAVGRVGGLGRGRCDDEKRWPDHSTSLESFLAGPLLSRVAVAIQSGGLSAYLLLDWGGPYVIPLDRSKHRFPSCEPSLLISLRAPLGMFLMCQAVDEPPLAARL